MRLFFVVIGFKVKHYKNRGAFKFPCHCEPQARLNFRVIASVSVAIPRNKARHIERKRNIPPNYRNTHYTVFASVPRQSLFSLSLRGSVATAAIPSKN